MSSAIQRRRGTTAQHATFAGLNAELTVDTDKEVVVVHDGTTAGGYPLMRENASNSALALGSAATPSLKFTGDTNTGIYSPGADQVAISTAGSGRLFVDASGNVGVGVTPVANLQVKSSTNAPANIVAFLSGGGSTSNGNGVALAFSNEIAVSRAKCGIGNVRVNNFDRSDLVFYTNNDAVSGSFDSNDERLRITAAGLVGIGTSSPQDTLTVDTSIGVYRASSDPTLSFSVGGTVSAPTKRYRLLIDDSDSDKFQLRDDVTPRVTVDGSGNVGIGTASPGTLLDLSSSTNTYQTIQSTGANNNALTYYKNSAAVLSGFSVGFNADEEAMLWQSENNALRFGTNNTERLRITSAGFVGIGTSSPSQKLEVAGSVGNIQLMSSGAEITFTRNDGNFITASGASGYLGFQTGGTNERLRITSAGNVGIGTTSPSSLLELKQLTGDTELRLYSNTGYVSRIGAIGSDNLAFSTGFTERVRIDSSGRLGIGTTSANTSIDVRTISTTAYSASNLSAYTGAYISNDGTGGFANITLNAADATGNSNCITAISAISESSGTRNSALAFATRTHSTGNIVERARIDSSGRLLVGTSTGSSNGTLFALMPDTSNQTGIVVRARNTGGTASQPALVFEKPNTTINSAIVSDIGTGYLGFVQNGAERFRISNNGSFSSVIPGGSTLYPSFACRAWVNFNGTGTVAIRASGNVSSITDNGVGRYTVNFTTAMPDANYSVPGMASGDGSFGGVFNTTGLAAGSVGVWYIQNNAPAFVDPTFATIAIFR